MRLAAAWIVLVVGVAFLLGYQVGSAPTLADNDKESLVDLWFVGHFVYGVILAGCWWRIVREKADGPWLTSHWFFLAVTSMFVWEALELQMELGHFGPSPKVWMDGVEPIANRFLLDPLVGFVGMMACRRWPRMWSYTFAFGLLFEAVQVASPTSMYIQQQLVAAVSTGTTWAFGP